MFDITQVLSIVNNSDEGLMDQLASEAFGAIGKEGDYLSQHWFVDNDDEELVESSNEIFWWTIQILSNRIYSYKIKILSR